MGKPVVIIADTDEKYIAPLEMKFLDEFDDEIQLQIISDIDYFVRRFEEPQSADIMIVSEQLYSRELQKHSIGNIFVLTENMDNQETGELGVERIYKYTSSQEIFNQVIAMSSLSSEVGKEKDTEVIMFCSASGGVGKTTLALSLSGELARRYKRVLYVNAERINTFQAFFGDTEAVPLEAYADFAFKDKVLYSRVKHVIRNEIFDYLPPFSVALSSINVDFSMYELFIDSAVQTKAYDYIIVDTDHVFDEAKAALITKADKVLFVVEQNEKSVHAMNVLMQNTNCRDTEKYRFICNKFDSAEDNLTSKSVKNRFVVNEYIKRIGNLNKAGLSELIENKELQKLVYLIV